MSTRVACFRPMRSGTFMITRKRLLRRIESIAFFGLMDRHQSTRIGDAMQRGRAPVFVTLCAMKRTAVLLLSLAAALPLFGAWNQPVRARNVMVASTSEIASRVGADVMKRGGNAVDAAVAVGLALAVTWPSAGNLGGGGFMLIRKADGTTEAIDFRERAPLAASRDMYLDAQGNVVKGMSTDGYRAVAVPGTVAGLVLAHKRHGKLKWED